VAKWIKWSYYVVIGIYVIFIAVLIGYDESKFLKIVILTNPYISLYLAIGSGLVLGLAFTILYELNESHRKPTHRSSGLYINIILFILSVFLSYSTIYTYLSGLRRMGKVTDPEIRELIIDSLSSDIIIVCLVTTMFAMYTVSIIAYFMRSRHSKAIIDQVC